MIIFYLSMCMWGFVKEKLLGDLCVLLAYYTEGYYLWNKLIVFHYFQIVCISSAVGSYMCANTLIQHEQNYLLIMEFPFVCEGKKYILSFNCESLDFIKSYKNRSGFNFLQANNIRILRAASYNVIFTVQINVI